MFKKVFRVRSASKDQDIAKDGQKGAKDKGKDGGRDGNTKGESKEKFWKGERVQSKDKDKETVLFRDYSNDKDKRSSSLKLTKI